MSDNKMSEFEENSNNKLKIESFRNILQQILDSEYKFGERGYKMNDFIYWYDRHFNTSLPKK